MKANRFGLESRHRATQDKMRRDENVRDMWTVVAIFVAVAVMFALAAKGVI
jgi:hypothetical protein